MRSSISSSTIRTLGGATGVASSFAAMMDWHFHPSQIS
jgi:hypothetical protein